MTTPEPLLEMTPEEWRQVGSYYNAGLGGELELIDFLLRVEAGRRQADFWRLYNLGAKLDKARIVWTPADWLAEVEREIERK